MLYCRANQSTEEEMYGNRDAGPAFEEFLEVIGQRVRMKGFTKHRAGLDPKSELIELVPYLAKDILFALTYSLLAATY